MYAHQCPWHIKSVTDLTESAARHGIDLKCHEITTANQAQHVPGGYGTFSLIKDGVVLADHYISKTRFENILKKELT